jgi:hypothetical protein
MNVQFKLNFEASRLIASSKISVKRFSTPEIIPKYVVSKDLRSCKCTVSNSVPTTIISICTAN